MPYTPTDAEVRELLGLLCHKHGFPWHDANFKACGFILAHYEPRTNEQRCSGAGWLDGIEIDPNPINRINCPGCRNCKPQATPKSDGSHAPGVSTAASDTRDRPAQAQVAPAVAAPVTSSVVTTYTVNGAPMALLIELGPATLGALYELLYEVGALSDTQRMNLLATLHQSGERGKG